MSVERVLLVLLAAKAVDAFELVPPNGLIEVNDKEGYKFGIDENWSDPPLKTCYYSSDTGESGSFDILTPTRDRKSNNAKEEMHNIITYLGHEGLCYLQVDKVNSTGPRKWMLTGEGTDGRNVTGGEFFVTFYFYGNILQTEVKMFSGKSFYNHLIPIVGRKFVKCQVKVKDLVLDLNIDQIVGNEGEGLAKNIFSLGHGLCGLKYDHAVHDDISYVYWNLSATDDAGDSYRNRFRTAVQASFGIFSQTKSVVLGTPILIACGDQINQRYCTLFNPAGEVVVTENCKLNINSFGVHHLGRWKCLSSSIYSLDTIEYDINYVRIDPQRLLPIFIDTDEKEVTIGCEVERYSFGEYTYCILTAPNRTTFNVRKGSALERYTTIGTNFNKGICLVQIKKPLQDFENGYWRCQIVGPYQHDFGGVFIKVGTVKPPSYVTRTTTKVEMYQPFGIFCHVPYESDYCYIKSPNGTIYKNVYHARVRIGECYAQIASVVPSDNGTWTCYFARDTGIPSEEIVVELVISDVLHSYNSVEVDDGDGAQLLCTSDGLPFSYCEFIAPDGKAYFIKNQTSSTKYLFLR
ncbi:hypothetical protein FQR65_LT04853 [Abscondita terminalis]|nr:hypothetical protein FQR65_LT04853 [Abscondita terminalis]